MEEASRIVGFIVPPSRPGEYSIEIIIFLIALCFDIRMPLLLHLVPLHNGILEYLHGDSLVALPLVIRVAVVQEALGS